MKLSKYYFRDPVHAALIVTLAVSLFGLFLSINLKSDNKEKPVDQESLSILLESIESMGGSGITAFIVYMLVMLLKPLIAWGFSFAAIYFTTRHLALAIKTASASTTVDEEG